MVFFRQILIIAAALCLVACSADSAGAPVESTHATGSPEAAAKTVSSLLVALKNRDCAAVEPLLGGEVQARFQAKSCDEIMSHDKVGQTPGVHVGHVTRDGRDPNAFLVKVHLGEGADARVVLFRVEFAAGKYVVVAM